ncbi:hypothetical protein F5Y18DRAFT_430093 [Xylariaceae sp. FL1019]|nr:hypothetical protein F5Y18DRAFT_430093 [Xylariaceae sp. FL1019]
MTTPNPQTTNPLSTTPQSASTPTPKLSSSVSKSHTLHQSTIHSPYSYTHLSLYNATPSPPPPLDALQVRSYLSSALSQFLGATGLSIPISILKVSGSQTWIRVPRGDLAAFAAAITAWTGVSHDGIPSTFRVMGCSDWLGVLVGQEDEDTLWRG